MAEDVLEAALVVVVPVRGCATAHSRALSADKRTAAGMCARQQNERCNTQREGRTRVVHGADVDHHVQRGQHRRVARAHNLRVTERLKERRGAAAGVLACGE